MKPYPRIRKTIKWVGVVVMVLLIVAWLGSGRWWIAIGNSTGGVLTLESGRLNVLIRAEISSYTSTPGLSLTAHDYRLSWTFESRHQGDFFYCIPLWSFVLVAGIMTWGLWWYDALASRCDRLSQIRCPTCNYDRKGISLNAPCPECGYSIIE